MRDQTGLTRVDAAVTLACVALVLAQAGMINTGGRERAKREVCLANLRTLTAAWQMYAQENSGKLVNGGQVPSNFPAPTEPYWCTSFNTPTDPGYDWSWTAGSGAPVLNFEQRVEKLKKGALYGYVQNLDIYRCPEADKNMQRSYVMPTSMNAAWQGGGSVFPTFKVAKNTGQIARPNERIVFLEERTITPDAFQFPDPIAGNNLCDVPSIMHGNGINLGFADGHAEYHQWECESTIQWCKKGISYNTTVAADTCFNTKDRVWLRKAIWGD